MAICKYFVGFLPINFISLLYSVAQQTQHGTKKTGGIPPPATIFLSYFFFLSLFKPLFNPDLTFFVLCPQDCQMSTSIRRRRRFWLYTLPSIYIFSLGSTNDFTSVCFTFLVRNLHYGLSLVVLLHYHTVSKIRIIIAVKRFRISRLLIVFHCQLIISTRVRNVFFSLTVKDKPTGFRLILMSLFIKEIILLLSGIRSNCRQQQSGSTH